MNSDNTNELKRASDPRWSTIASGDNGIELLQYVIDVAVFNEAARVGTEIASWIAPYGREDPVVFTQVSLRGWRVEIGLAAPIGEWTSVSQQKLASTINDRFGSGMVSSS